MNLFLIGFMGAGKSTLGRKAAKEWNWTFVDLDDFIESREGATIPAIFESKGESAFREIETRSLEEVVKLPASSRIIATGGGTPCFGENLQIMNQIGKTVYLRPNLEILTERLWDQKHYRPIIRDIPEAEFSDYIKSLVEKRETFYMKAQYILEENQINVNALAGIAWR